MMIVSDTMFLSGFYFRHYSTRIEINDSTKMLTWQMMTIADVIPVVSESKG